MDRQFQFRPRVPVPIVMHRYGIPWLANGLPNRIQARVLKQLMTNAVRNGQSPGAVSGAANTGNCLARGW